MDNVLHLPLEPYTTGDFRRYGSRLRRRIFLWATHVGDDVVADPGTPVQAIGEGTVVWAEMRLGSERKRDWGGVVIVRHQVASGQLSVVSGQLFYSVYGHMKDLQVKVGDTVPGGQPLGVVAAGNTPENGWWQHPHLHFAIYTGPWKNRILPGYARPDDWLRPGAKRRTRRRWWHNPREFIVTYNKSA